MDTDIPINVLLDYPCRLKHFFMLNLVVQVFLDCFICYDYKSET